MIARRKTKQVPLKGLTFGGKTIYIQSMLNVPARDIAGNVAQAKALAAAGCDIIRFAIPDKAALDLIEAVKNAVDTPLVADIHFDYKLALGAVERGIDKIRINPGNIGGEDRVKAVAVACANAGVPIRIGVNAGSLEKHILEKYNEPTPQALAESALYHISLLNRFDFDNIVVSMKASSVPVMVQAYRLLAEQCDYPFHLGVTEAGTERMGIIKSAVGIGALLMEGIGDTIRVSLTADPLREVYAAQDILKSAGLSENDPQLIACPTCGRTKIDLISLANRVEEALRSVKKPIKVAVMGCAVNGPGEARQADIGIAGGDGCAVLFKKGEIIRKLEEPEILPVLLEEIEKL